MKQSSSLQNSHKDLALAIMVPASGAPLAFVANILIARYLGVEAFGNYMVLLSGAYLFTAVATLGTQQVLIREFAAESGPMDTARNRSVGRWGLSRFMVSSLLGCALFFGMLWWNPWLTRATSELALIAAVLLVWSSALLIIVIAFLVGRGGVVACQTLEAPLRNGLLLIAVLLIALWPAVEDKIGATLLVQVGSFLLAAFAGWYWLRSRHGGLALRDYLQPGVSTAVTIEQQRRWDRQSWVFFIGTAGTLLLNRMDIILVAYIGDSNTAGLYGAAMRIGQLVAMIGHAGSLWLQPRIAYHFRQHQHRNLVAIIRNGTLLIAVGSSLVGLVVLLGAKTILNWLGADFIAAAPALRWITCGHVLWASSLPLFVFLSMSGSEALAARIVWLQLVINVLLTLILVPNFGLMGACMAWLTGVATATGMVAYCGISKLHRIQGAASPASDS